ncbi:hypothetical protein ACFU99_10580 [Streptomyces sp. NPDC057654]|uniref:hypothetical protein n=1 Tax=Streptomyces sp. NPDC057654 TaxID=3346196 RepID=UPI0036A68BBB
MDAVRAAVLRALESADPQERPGLERAISVIDDECALTDSDLRKRWVLRVLADRGLDPGEYSVGAVAAVRETAPALSLVTAAQMVQEATNTPGAAS